MSGVTDSEDHYDIAKRAIQEAEDEDEVYQAYKQYDATEGAALRRIDNINKRLLAIDNERYALENELKDVGNPVGFRQSPIKEVAAVKIFEMLYVGVGDG